MGTNIRKSLVNLSVLVFTSIIIPRSLLNANIEVYYDEDELTSEIIVYEYTKPSGRMINVYEACPNKCPNETLSEGYGEPDPQDSYKEETKYRSNEVPLVVDPVLLNYMRNQWFNY